MLVIFIMLFSPSEDAIVISILKTKFYMLREVQ